MHSKEENITNSQKVPSATGCENRSQNQEENRLWKNKFLLIKDVQNYQEFCRLRYQVRRQTRKAQKQYEKDIINQIKHNPKKFWQYAQAKMATRMGIPNLIKSEDDKDDLTKSDSEKAQVLADYFSSVFTREPEGETPEELIRCSKTIELRKETKDIQITRTRWSLSSCPTRIGEQYQYSTIHHI